MRARLLVTFGVLAAFATALGGCTSENTLGGDCTLVKKGPGDAGTLFVETDDGARGVIRDNIEALGLFGSTRIHRRDATDLGLKPAGLGDPFDLVFLDPPYGKGLGEAALAGLGDGAWITRDALIVLEVGAAEAPSLPAFETLGTRDYGAAKVLFLKPR
jgi:16S rRNA (guanine966-N2)-methyltransferase